MKILKYIFLLLLLVTVSFIVFILTNSADFTVTKTFVVDANKEIVYEYLRNTNNWNNWIKTQQNIDKKTIISFDELQFNEINNIKEFPNDSLIQSLKTNKTALLHWNLKPIGNKTEINFKISGTLNFRTKILHFFSGSPNQIITKATETHFSKLVHYFISQYNEFDLETTGITSQDKIRYIYINNKSSLNHLDRDNKAAIEKLQKFSKDNNINPIGEPLIIMNQKKIKDSISYRTAIAIKEKIFLTSNDWVKKDSIPENLIFKASLKGYYLHLPIALEEINNSIFENGIRIKEEQNIFFSLKQNSNDTPYPAQWKTEINIPIYPTETETLINNI